MKSSTETHTAISIARLNESSPESVYEELRSYGRQFSEDWTSSRREEIEEGLLERNSRLINLGLAEFATSEKVVKRVYDSVQSANQSNGSYEKGLRVACLANEVVGTRFNFRYPEFWLGDDEFKRLIAEAGADELEALFANPTIDGSILGELFSRGGDFEALTEDRWFQLVSVAARNPRPNIDKSSEHGPDLQVWNLHSGILRLLEIAPTEPHWLYVVHQLLLRLDPDLVAFPKEDIANILSRWTDTSVPITFGDDKGKEETGWFTPIAIKDEFCCLIASLYGRKLDDAQQWSLLGDAASEELTSRCAYYGKASLTKKQMEEGYKKDGEVFLFAALQNGDVFHSRENRAFLEEKLRGDLGTRYAHRCSQIHSRNSWFDPKPITDQGVSLMEDAMPAKEQPENNKALENISATLQQLRAELNHFKVKALWIVVGLAALLFFK